MDKSTTASFDVDAQKGFTPICPNELPVPGGDTIVDALNEQATFASVRVGSKDAHPASAIWSTDVNGLTQLSPVKGSSNVDIAWNSHCVVGTLGFELLDGLPSPLDYDFFVYKGVERDAHPYGPCYHTLNWKENRKSTGVIEFLQSKNITTVIVGGLATDYCVKTAALQLRDAGFEVIVNLKACRGIAQQTIDAAVIEMDSAGIIVVEDIIKYQRLDF